MKLVLASASEARQALLRRAGVPFEAVAPGVPELKGRGRSLRQVVLANAERKAAAVALLRPGRWVLAADTMIEFDRRLYGKPAGREAAVALLARMAGRRHVLATGVVLRRDRRVIRGVVRSGVRIRPLSAAAIRRILARDDPAGSAGGYQVRAKDDPLVERIDGSFSNVVGLPIEWVLPRLRAAAIPARGCSSSGRSP